jgi:uncharacterized membrane protein YoaK (UPF0700 family)
MPNQIREAWQTLVPPANAKHGPLPPLLILLTVVTGLVDAFSYLSLGHVFVANMTGNIIFLAFSLAGVQGFSAWASLVAIAAFLVGSLIGGRIAHRYHEHRARAVFFAIAGHLALVLAAFICAVAFGSPYGVPARATLIVLLAAGMGIQNAIARSLGVPDLTTTVLTLTITGISADSRLARGTDSKIGRRIVSIASMFVGALIGAILVTVGHGPWALLLATILLAVVCGAGLALFRSTKGWIAAAS